MSADPHRTRTGALPEGRHLLLALALIAASVAAVAFTAVYAWGELSRIAAAFGFEL